MTLSKPGDRPPGNGTSSALDIAGRRPELTTDGDDQAVVETVTLMAPCVWVPMTPPRIGAGR